MFLNVQLRLCLFHGYTEASETGSRRFSCDVHLVWHPPSTSTWSINLIEALIRGRRLQHTLVYLITFQSHNLEKARRDLGRWEWLCFTCTMQWMLPILLVVDVSLSDGFRMLAGRTCPGNGWVRVDGRAASGPHLVVLDSNVWWKAQGRRCDFWCWGSSHRVNFFYTSFYKEWVMRFRKFITESIRSKSFTKKLRSILCRKLKGQWVMHRVDTFSYLHRTCIKPAAWRCVSPAADLRCQSVDRIVKSSACADKRNDDILLNTFPWK